MRELITIRITKETLDLPRKIGQNGETYNSTLRRLIEIGDRFYFYNEQKRILEVEEFITIEKL